MYRCTLTPVFLLAVLMCSTALAQDRSGTFGISFTGFVKTDMMYDSRQTVSAREGHFLLYPAHEWLDRHEEDINAHPSFNMLSIQTRLRGNISGPDAFGASTSGAIEAEFFGTVDNDINGFRLRHAYVAADWGSTSVLVGQTWHPMFVAEVFPGVVSFNTGVPFQPFSRNPQLRLMQEIGALRMIAVAATQRDFQSFGPDASGRSVASSAFMRNSVLPNLHLQAQYANKGYIFGAGVDYKELTPRLVTSENVRTDTRVGSLAGLAYARVDAAPLTLKAQAVVGENLADLLMFGGYAVTSVDQTTGAETYTTLGGYSLWGEIIHGRDVELAVFAGYAGNLGAGEEFIGSPYARAANIDHVYRISPRVQWTSGKMRISTELEYTTAAYGTMNTDGSVRDAKTVENLRLLAAVWYFF
ncbi:MAG: hypothetical protein KFH87_04530 [Bacteroidetes bacterium]|nr:hypothetical protein [Bacteroidota bacterium]